MITRLLNQPKLIIIVALSTIFCSCAARISSPADMFKDDLKKASPDFRKGWIDGCNSGSHAGSNAFNQMFQKNNAIDGYKMSYSNDYQVAWGNAWWYCYRKDWTSQRSTIYNSVFGGYK